MLRGANPRAASLEVQVVLSKLHSISKESVKHVGNLQKYEIDINNIIPLYEEFKFKNRIINCYQFEIFAIKAGEKKKIIRKYVIFFIITSKISIVM